MRIAVFGTGGVGGYFGGVLAKAGHEVSFIARGSHLAAMREKGLQVKSVHGDFHLFPVRAIDVPAEVGVVETVLVCVKDYHLQEAAHQILPLVGPETMVVPLLNGVDAHATLADTVGAGKVIGGLCAVVALVAAPGVIRQESQLRRVVLGELDHARSERVARLVQAWAETGVEAIHAPNIHVALWTKFVFIASFGGVGSLTGLPVGGWRAVPETRALYLAALKEIEAVGRASGVPLPEGVAEGALGMADGFEAGTMSSMQRDVAAGNLFELEAFSGKVVRLGQQFGVPTPVHQAIYGFLRPALIRAGG